MRGALACCSTVIILAGCSTSGATLPPGAAGGSFLDAPRANPSLGATAVMHRLALDAAARRHAEAEADVLLEVREQSQALRHELLVIEGALEARVARDEPLTRSDLQRVRDLAHTYLELDVLLYALWTHYRAYLPHGSEPDPYAPMSAATVLSPPTRELGGLVSLAAEVMRLDNAEAVVRVLRPHHALTRLLNRGDPLLKLPAEGFDRCLGILLDPDHRSLLEHQLRAVADERERLATTTDRRVGFLLDTIHKSNVARAIVDETDGQRRLAFVWAILTRSTLNTAAPVLDAVIANDLLATEAQ